jgi:hypothetical protein
MISARYSLDHAAEAIGAVRAGSVLKVALHNRGKEDL